MRIGEKGIELIKKFEGWYSKPYRDPIGIPTIGYGFTYYPDTKKRVTMLDREIAIEEGDDMLIEVLKGYEDDVKRLVKKPLSQNQFDALVSFTYNLGATNLSKSTLLKKINKNPNNSSIRDEFKKWRLAGGKPLAGLERRRIAEADLYFS